jgi:hypothetical protein
MIVKAFNIFRLIGEEGDIILYNHILNGRNKIRHNLYESSAASIFPYKADEI